jgi:hypothetical protein
MAVEGMRNSLHGKSSLPHQHGIEQHEACSSFVALLYGNIGSLDGVNDIEDCIKSSNCKFSKLACGRNKQWRRHAIH